jgi:hypothetical protein
MVTVGLVWVNFCPALWVNYTPAVTLYLSIISWALFFLDLIIRNGLISRNNAIASVGRVDMAVVLMSRAKRVSLWKSL